MRLLPWHIPFLCTQLRAAGKGARRCRLHRMLGVRAQAWLHCLSCATRYRDILHHWP